MVTSQNPPSIPTGFGVGLYQPVDHYQQVTRAVKYGALFLLLPFVALFMIERISGVRIHPIQYVLVGSSKIVFYLLLLSMSEHLGFGSSYVVAAVATIGLLVTHAGWVLRRPRSVAVYGGLLVAEYVYLFTALGSEDFALLIGSVGLFVLLTAVIVATRRIDWYAGRQESAATRRGELPH